MSKIVENYMLQEVVGSGQYGKVYKAKNMKNEDIVAIKVIKLTKFCEIPKLEEFTLNEIKTLSKIENPNVVRFIEMLKTSNNMYLVYEFCNGGTLEQILTKKKYLSEKETLVVFRQLLNAFKTLYKENILHRDLKPSNILLHNGVIKVADFGFCKSLKGPLELTQTMVGSPIYMAPEVLKGHSYSSKADIWSLGVALFEMLYGVCPFEEKSIQRLLNLIETRGFVMPTRHANQVSAKTEDMLRMMLNPDPSKRCDWAGLLNFEGSFGTIPTPPVLAATQQSENATKTATSSWTSRNIGTTTPSSSGPPNLTINPQAIAQQHARKNSSVTPQSNSTGVIFKDNSNVMGYGGGAGVQPVSPYAGISALGSNSTSTSKPRNPSTPSKQHEGGEGSLIGHNGSGLSIQSVFGVNEKILARERNKMFFLAQSLQTAIDMNLSKYTPTFCVGLSKFLSSSYGQFRQSFITGTVTQTVKGLEKWEQFKQSNECIRFGQVIEKELDESLRLYQLYRDEYIGFVGNGSDIPANTAEFRRSVVKYLEESFQKQAASGGDIEKKILIHLNEVADILMLDECFENFIDLNSKYTQQKYFESLRSTTSDQLLLLLNQKMEYAKGQLC